jgi:hypothetical protein
MHRVAVEPTVSHGVIDKYEIMYLLPRGVSLHLFHQPTNIRTAHKLMQRTHHRCAFQTSHAIRFIDMAWPTLSSDRHDYGAFRLQRVLKSPRIERCPLVSDLVI